jgi:hypothetical protein
VHGGAKGQSVWLWRPDVWARLTTRPGASPSIDPNSHPLLRFVHTDAPGTTDQGVCHDCTASGQACRLRDSVAVTQTACFVELDERHCSRPGRLGGIARICVLFGGWARKARLPVAARPDHKVVGPPSGSRAFWKIVNGVPSHLEFMPLSPVSIRRTLWLASTESGRLHRPLTESDCLRLQTGFCGGLGAGELSRVPLRRVPLRRVPLRRLAIPARRRASVCDRGDRPRGSRRAGLRAR